MNKKVKIGDKYFELKEVTEGEDTPVEAPVEETPAVEETPVEEVPVVETPVEAPVEEVPAVSDQAIEEATEKIYSRLGLKDLNAKMDKILESKEAPASIKSSALIDLETLMNKNVSEMTPKEKIVGFFQGLLKSDHAVLKALSEGTSADGGYLFPKFVGA